MDGPGVGHLWCIDAMRRPRGMEKDLSPVKDNFDPRADVNRGSGLVWHLGGMAKQGNGRQWMFGRTLSSVAIHDGLVIAPDIDGYVDCLDARTGRKYWTHDTENQIQASPLIADGKVYVPTDGDVVVLALSREKKVLAVNDMNASVRADPVFANG